MALTPIPAVTRAVERWLHHHDSRAPGLIEGLYLVGSVALDDWTPASDIDIIAFTPDGLTTAEVEALRIAHVAASADPDSPHIDGPRLRWGDVRQAPTPVRRPWTLEREFNHDDGCFELNPVMWHTLARHGVTVRGPAPAALSVHTDDAGLRSFVIGNTTGYWRSEADRVAAALADRDRTEFRADSQSWCVLGVARMLATARTGQVLSKAGAGRWLLDREPRYRDLIEQALTFRAGGGDGTVDRCAVEALSTYLDDIIARVEAVDPEVSPVG